ncbi:MAG TPA: LamG domain-containing protein [Kofleriaceae bacterium]
MRLAALVAAIAIMGCGRIGFDADGARDGGIRIDGPATFPGGSPTVRQRLDLDRFSADEALTNFPLLVQMTGSRVDGATLGDSSTVRFRDSSGAVIPHEIDDRIDNSYGRFWVRVPRYAGTSSFIFVEYGGTPVAASTDNVWSEGYFGVWHLQSASPIDDSSSVHRATQSVGSTPPLSGFFGAGLAFDSTDAADYLRIDGTTGGLAEITMSAWFNSDMPSTGGNGTSALVTREFADDGDDDFWLGLDDADRTSMGIATGASTEYAEGSPVSFGTWTHLVGTWSTATGKAELYENGERVGGIDISGSAVVDSSHPIFIGGGHNDIVGVHDDADNDYFDGVIDEVRLASRARTPAWVAAEHASETDAAITYGPIERL